MLLRNTAVQPNLAATSLVEVLSLATFNPARALPPYLNSPRSIEACRVYGINPIELVEISVDEFRKDFPNDPDAALRRFQRIDGARRRLLLSVTEEWNRLCEIGWTSQMDASKLVGRAESIIAVAPEYHSTMLEIQADKFRNFEEEQWRELQRTLAVEIKRAYEESRNRDILKRHKEIQDNNEATKQQRQTQRLKAYADKVEHHKILEEEERKRIADFQQKEYDAAMKKLAQDKMNAIKHKAWLEEQRQKQMDKENEAKRIRDEYFESQEAKFKRSKELQAEIDRRTAARMQFEKEEKHRMMVRERQKQEQKIQKAKNDVAAADAAKRTFIAQKEKERDELILKNLEDVNAKKREIIGADRLRDKIMRAKEQAEEAENEKIEKTKAELEYKEMLARQELDRVRDAQERRRNIKAIRQESFELAAVRQKKAVDHKNDQLLETIRRKKERARAIKEGEDTLSRMRTNMKEVILKTTYELREELNRLNDLDVLSPEKVIERMALLSESTLFPSLRRRFGPIQRVSTLKTRIGSAAANSKRPHTVGGMGGPEGAKAFPRSSSAGAGDFPFEQGGGLYTSEGVEEDSMDATRGLFPEVSSPGKNKNMGAASSTSKRYARADADARMHSAVQPERILSQSLDSLRMAAVTSTAEESHWNRHTLNSNNNNNTNSFDHPGIAGGGMSARAQLRSGSPTGHGVPTATSTSNAAQALVLHVPRKGAILASMERAKNALTRPSSANATKKEQQKERQSKSRSPDGARHNAATGTPNAGIAGNDLSVDGMDMSLTLGMSEDSEQLPPTTAYSPESQIRQQQQPMMAQHLQGDQGVVFRASGYPTLAQYVYPSGESGGYDGTMTGGFGHLAGAVGVGVDESFAMSESTDDGMGGSHGSSMIVDTMAATMTSVPQGTQQTMQMQSRQYVQTPGSSSSSNQQQLQQQQQQQQQANHRFGAMNISMTSSTSSHSQQHHPVFRPPPSSGLFRREFSADHPLAGGKGEYLLEKAQGLKPYVGASIMSGSISSDGKNSIVLNMGGSSGPSSSYKRVNASMNALNGLDPHHRVEHVRREQNEMLLRVLDEERRAEENRVQFLRDALSRPGATGGYVSEDEKRQLELLFADERRRASERIVRLTKDHEANLKNVMMSLIQNKT